MTLPTRLGNHPRRGNGKAVKARGQRELKQNMSSGHDRTAAHMNSQKVGLLKQDTHKIRLANIPALREKGVMSSHP